jgi:hypothetical protein
VDRAEYLLRRRTEVRSIRDRATAIDAELTAALSDPGAAGEVNDLRFGEWVEARRRQLEHIEVELFVLAYEAPPPVWLIVEPVRVRWWWPLPWPR